MFRWNSVIGAAFRSGIVRHTYNVDEYYRRLLGLLHPMNDGAFRDEIVNGIGARGFDATNTVSPWVRRAIASELPVKDYTDYATDDIIGGRAYR